MPCSLRMPCMPCLLPMPWHACAQRRVHGAEGACMVLALPLAHLIPAMSKSAAQRPLVTGNTARTDG